MSASGEASEQLCLNCGLCCNGVLFRDVELQPGDDEPALRAAGLPIARLKTKARFPQPCTALCADNTCRIYARRPQRCREFDCAQLRAVQAGTMELSTALRTIGEALRLVGKVEGLLTRLGDDDTQLPLSRRFQRTARRLERVLPDEETAATYADLTLAVHELNTVLHAAFHVPATGRAEG